MFIQVFTPLKKKNLQFSLHRIYIAKLPIAFLKDFWVGNFSPSFTYPRFFVRLLFFLLNFDAEERCGLWLWMDAEIEEIENKIFGKRNTFHMAPRTPRPVVTVDVKKKTWEQPTPLHNRWHPEIPPVGEVKEGELFRVETVDWTGGQILDDDSAEDMKHIDLTTVM